MFPLLPYEVLLKIAFYLNDEDFIVFTITFDANMTFPLPRRRRQLSLARCYNLSIISIQEFFTAGSKWGSIQKLDVSDCYWFEADQLTHAILQASSTLTSLSVHGTKLHSSHLVEIMKQCLLLTQLSLAFNRGDSTFWIEDLKESEDVGCYVRLENCVFHKIGKCLSKLLNVSLHGDERCFVMFQTFLCFCTNLESLHLKIDQPECKISLQESLAVSQQIRKIGNQLPPCNNFRHFTCEVSCENENSNLFSLLINSIFSRKRFQIENFWAPNISISQYLQCLTLNIKSLQTSTCADSLHNFNELLSIRTHMQQYLRNYASCFPSLKQASFRYDPEYFLEFCYHHKDIEVLQLQNCFPYNPSVPGTEMNEGLGYLRKLTKISCSPKFFPMEDQISSPEKHLVNCHFLEEIEIGIPTLSSLESRRPTTLVHLTNSSSLNLLSCCKNLKKLTLAHLKVSTADFVSKVLSTCTRLESLRMTHIVFVGTQHSSVVTELERGLLLAKNLQDFRWEFGSEEIHPSEGLIIHQHEHITVNGTEILRVLALCQSLRRFAIIADKCAIINFDNLRLDWPRLILACIISPTFNLCTAAHLQITSSHPAFQYYFGQSKAEAQNLISVFHFDEMINFEPCVARLPYRKTPL